MSKRLRKKKALQSQINFLMAENVLLTESVKRQSKLIEGIHELNSRNAEATNVRFDKIEKSIKDMKQAKKKSWFGYR